MEQDGSRKGSVGTGRGGQGVRLRPPWDYRAGHEGYVLEEWYRIYM